MEAQRPLAAATQRRQESPARVRARQRAGLGSGATGDLPLGLGNRVPPSHLAGTTVHELHVTVLVDLLEARLALVQEGMGAPPLPPEPSLTVVLDGLDGRGVDDAELPLDGLGVEPDPPPQTADLDASPSCSSRFRWVRTVEGWRPVTPATYGAVTPCLPGTARGICRAPTYGSSSLVRSACSRLPARSRTSLPRASWTLSSGSAANVSCRPAPRPPAPHSGWTEAREKLSIEVPAASLLSRCATSREPRRAGRGFKCRSQSFDPPCRWTAPAGFHLPPPCPGAWTAPCVTRATPLSVPSTSGCCWMGRARARQSRVCPGAQLPALPGRSVVAGRTADPRTAPGRR